MGVLMDRIILRIPRDDQFIDNIIDALKSIKPNCAWVEGEWEGLVSSGMKFKLFPNILECLQNTY